MADVAGYYQDTDVESDRLEHGQGLLEKLRTQDLMRRLLPASPAVIYDIGGAQGVYSFPLAEQGYEVHLFDPVEAYIEKAREKNDQAEHKLVELQVGDARKLDAPDESADAVLLLGPLYHLTERGQRLESLAEAMRILKPGGIIFAAGISRFSSLMDGVLSGYWRDPYFEKIVHQDLLDGQHRNEKGDPKYFTTAFFHHPDELKDELQEAGFSEAHIRAIEGPFWLFGNLAELLAEMSENSVLFTWLRDIEKDASLLGASSHIMGIGYKPE